MPWSERSSWAMGASISRPPRCERGALPTELIARESLTVAKGRARQLAAHRRRRRTGDRGDTGSRPPWPRLDRRYDRRTQTSWLLLPSTNASAPSGQYDPGRGRATTRPSWVLSHAASRTVPRPATATQEPTWIVPSTLLVDFGR